MNTIKIFGLSLLVALVFSNNVQAQEPAAELTAADYAKGIQEFYKKTKDFQSKFVQTYTDLAAGESKVSQGIVYFKKPGKMRWDYYQSSKLKKRNKIYVSDGNVFWIYESEFKQVFKQCLKESQLPSSLRFLMGEGDLLEDFEVSFAKKSTKEKPMLKLVPKAPTSKYKELRFTVDPKTHQVLVTTLYDPYGNSNKIEFRTTRVNRNLPDSGFRFKVPRGAREINPEKKCT